MRRFFAIFSVILILIFQCGCNNSISDENTASFSEGLKLSEHVKNEYASCFSIDRYEGGFSMITTMKGERFFVVPEA